VVEEGVLAAVDRGVIDAAKGNAYVGECRFIRALAHLELAVHFCRPYTDGNGSEPGVPYRKIAITSPSRVEEEVSKPRGTVAEMYTAMLEDLDFAETNLPDTRTGRLKITRATKGAAIGLKVRVNMHKADYPAAITEANKIIPQDAAPFSSPIGGYQLEASVDGMWFPGITATASRCFPSSIWTSTTTVPTAPSLLCIRPRASTAAALCG
jgi:starch-binding outer membrane protein, SusD/RagB family